MSAPIERMCHRCLQPLPHKAARCPNCGERPEGTIRNLPALLATGGILALAFLVWIMIAVFRNQQFTSAPSGDQNGVTQEQAKPPAFDK